MPSLKSLNLSTAIYNPSTVEYITLLLLHYITATTLLHYCYITLLLLHYITATTLLHYLHYTVTVEF